MHKIYFLLTLLVISCASPKKHQTYTYDKYAHQHRSIAILPIVVEGREIDDDLKFEDQNKLLLKEQEFIQNHLYQTISKATGREDKDIHIEIISPNKVNNLLKENGVDLLKIKDVSDAQLLKILNVDAVFKTSVYTKIMLHSTDYDVAKEAIKIATVVFNDPVLGSIANTDLHSVFLRTEIVDLRNESPIWTYSKKRSLDLNDKHTDLLTNLCSDVAKRFPYRGK